MENLQNAAVFSLMYAHLPRAPPESDARERAAIRTRGVDVARHAQIVAAFKNRLWLRVAAGGSVPRSGSRRLPIRQRNPALLPFPLQSPPLTLPYKLLNCPWPPEAPWTDEWFDLRVVREKHSKGDGHCSSPRFTCGSQGLRNRDSVGRVGKMRSLTILASSDMSSCPYWDSNQSFALGPRHL